jgi:hypothetical protein
MAVTHPKECYMKYTRVFKTKHYSTQSLTLAQLYLLAYNDV